MYAIRTVIEMARGSTEIAKGDRILMRHHNIHSQQKIIRIWLGSLAMNDRTNLWPANFTFSHLVVRCATKQHWPLCVQKPIWKLNQTLGANLVHFKSFSLQKMHLEWLLLFFFFQRPADFYDSFIKREKRKKKRGKLCHISKINEAIWFGRSKEGINCRLTELIRIKNANFPLFFFFSINH